MREILTSAVLHHPLLLGEIPMHITSISGSDVPALPCGGADVKLSRAAAATAASSSPMQQWHEVLLDSGADDMGGGGGLRNDGSSVI